MEEVDVSKEFSGFSVKLQKSNKKKRYSNCVTLSVPTDRGTQTLTLTLREAESLSRFISENL